MGLIDAPLRLVHNFTGTAIGMVHIMLPFMVLPLYANDAAPSIATTCARPRTSGAAGDGVLARVRAAVAARPVRRHVMVFVLCLGFYITPRAARRRARDDWMQIERNVATYLDWGAASSLGVVLFAVTMLVFWVFRGCSRSPARPNWADSMNEGFVRARSRLWLFCWAGWCWRSWWCRC